MDDKSFSNGNRPNDPRNIPPGYSAVWDCILIDPLYR